MVRVKICGFTNSTDAIKACEAGADMIGVVVETPSPRNVSSAKAKLILSAVPRGVDKVVVMKPRDIFHAVTIARELKPDYLQIHAPMTAQELKGIKKSTGVRLIVTVAVPERVKNLKEVIARAHEAAKVADYVLVDTKHAELGGGTGRTHDWNTSRAIREAINKPLILAGGLNPKNVKKAINSIRPGGVDVSSGVESEPGKKDLGLLKEFIWVVREIETWRKGRNSENTADSL